MSNRVSRAFTLIELLVVIAIIAILAAILFPVFAQARGAARAISCVSNAKQYATATLMYAQDYDETIPRLDNNGMGNYGFGSYVAGGTDWGDPGTNPNIPAAMFANVIQPYIKSAQLGYCPEAGKTNWSAAAASYVGRPYDKRFEDGGHYYGAFGQMAVNILLVEWNPTADWTNRSTKSGPTGSIGALASFTRPAELVMLVADSVWDTSGTAVSGAVGNTGVWPSYPGSRCTQYGDPGWTWYVHKAQSRGGNPISGTRSDLGINSGMANVAFADGHVKPLKHNSLESCDFNTAAGVWAWTFWDPRY